MKQFLTTLLFIACSIVCQAVKIQPGIKSVKQSDGTVLNVRGFGNHDFYYFTTTDGVLLCKNGTDFHIAAVDAKGKLFSTGIIAHEAPLRNKTEREMIDKQDRISFFEKIEANVIKAKMAREPMLNTTSLLPHLGSPKIPVILVEFSDLQFTVENPEAVFNKYLNHDELFSKTTDPEMGRNYGSVKRYFNDMSFGKFTPQFDVYGPVKLNQTLKYYGGGNSNDENMKALFEDACSIVDDNVDFSQYDNDNNGYIDLVYIIHAGYGDNYIGNSDDCIYPKSGILTSSITLDGKRFSRYGVSSEINGTPEANAIYGLLINGIGVFCHEFSHCLGLPDLYADPAYDATSVAARCINHSLDYWDLMDAGEYKHNGYRPTEYSSWERERFEWLKIDTLNAPANITMQPVSAGGKAYRILNDKDESGKEYYILENVQQTGWNKYLPGHGMLVYHVDYDDSQFSVGGCKVNNVAGHPRMTIIAADGMFIPEYFIGKTIKEGSTDIEKIQNASLVDKYGNMVFTRDMYLTEEEGDPFPGIQGVTSLTDTTRPACSWVYRGEYMSKPITDITEDTDNLTVSFKFMGGDDNAIKHIKSDRTSDFIYSIDGRKLGNDKTKLKKGIYIIGNKKVCL